MVVSPTKTGTTSLALYFVNSGLLDSERDLYVIQPDMLNKVNKKYRYKAFSIEDPHRTFDDLRAKGAVQANMPCVSTIRNPLERFSSWYNFNRKMHLGHLGFIPKKFSDPNSHWDYIKEEVTLADLLPQNNYFPDHAELFNTENLHEHANKYILENGGNAQPYIKLRENLDNNLDKFLAELTPKRQQEVLYAYEKDFKLWEKAYAVYN